MNTSPDIFERCEKIKLIVSEMDGIVNKGLSGIGEMNVTLFKQYCLKDFEAINELKKTFIFAFVTADNSINYYAARARNIPLFYNQKDKKQPLVNLMQKYGVGPEEVLYIGTSFSDLENIKMIPFSMCPADAITDVKLQSYFILDTPAGDGVICEVYALLKPEIVRRQTLTI